MDSEANSYSPIQRKEAEKNTQEAVLDHSDVGGNHIQIRTEYSEGPLPAPYILREYDDIYPGAAKIIMDDFQENAKLVREMREKALSAEIETNRRGQMMAFLLLIGILLVLLYSLYLGNNTLAGVSGLAFLAVGATNLISMHKRK